MITHDTLVKRELVNNFDRLITLLATFHSLKLHDSLITLDS